MFSNRFTWETDANPLGRLMAEKKRCGRPLYDLTQSNPTCLGIDYPVQSILSAMSSEASLVYRPDPHGLPQARSAVADYYAAQGRGNELDIDRIFLTANTSEAYGMLFKLLADPGDEVLIPSPGYPLLSYLAVFENLKPVAYPLRYSDSKGWFVDLDLLDALITDKTRAIVVVNPNNPTGSYLTTPERQALDSICVRHGLALIVDEVFFDYPADDHDRSGSLVLNQTQCLTFVLNGLSKVLALPQVKLGWIAVCGQSKVIRAIHDLEILLDFYLSVSTPVQHALEKLLRWRIPIQRQITGRLSENYHFLCRSVADVGQGLEPAIRVLKRQGGWYAVIKFADRVSDDARVLQLLDESDILVHPGYFYDFGNEGYLVLSLLPPAAVFQTGVARMLAHLPQWV